MPGCGRRGLGDGGMSAGGISAAPPNDDEPGSVVLPGIEPVAGNVVTVLGTEADGDERSEDDPLRDGVFGGSADPPGCL